MVVVFYLLFLSPGIEASPAASLPQHNRASLFHVGWWIRESEMNGGPTHPGPSRFTSLILRGPWNIFAFFLGAQSRDDDGNDDGSGLLSLE